MCEEVGISRYVTKDTFDSYLWQLVENKQKFISQVMRSEIAARSCQDVDETVLSFAEVKALATGNPLIKEKMEVDNEVARLRVLKSGFEKQHYRLQDDITLHYPNRIAQLEERIKKLQADIAQRVPPSAEFQMIVDNVVIKESRAEAGDLLMKTIERESVKLLEIPFGEKSSTVPPILASYRGFDISMERSAFGDRKLIICGSGSVCCGNGHLVDQAISPDWIRFWMGWNPVLPKAEQDLDNTKSNLKQAELDFAKEFAYDDQLKQLVQRQAELNLALGVDKVDAIVEEQANTGSEKSIDHDHELEVDYELEV